MSITANICRADSVGQSDDGQRTGRRDAPCAQRKKYDMGLFSSPYQPSGAEESDPVDTNAESRLHRKAREVAQRKVWYAENRRKRCR